MKCFIAPARCQQSCRPGLLKHPLWELLALSTGCALQDSSFRGLVALGIAAVGSTSTSAFGATDAERFTGLTTTSAQLGANGEALALPISWPDTPHSAVPLLLAPPGWLKFDL